jgi:hypothetical protein
VSHHASTASRERATNATWRFFVTGLDCPREKSYHSKNCPSVAGSPNPSVDIESS